MSEQIEIPRKLVTQKIKELMAKVAEVPQKGDPITYAEKLAHTLMKLALGYVEEVRDKDGNRKLVTHEPAAWAVKELLDRSEGKPTTSLEVDATAITAGEQVSKLIANRIKKITSQVLERSQEVMPAEEIVNGE